MATMTIFLHIFFLYDNTKKKQTTTTTVMCCKENKYCFVFFDPMHERRSGHRRWGKNASIRPAVRPGDTTRHSGTTRHSDTPTSAAKLGGPAPRAQPKRTRRSAMANQRLVNLALRGGHGPRPWDLAQSNLHPSKRITAMRARRRVRFHVSVGAVWRVESRKSKTVERDRSSAQALSPPPLPPLGPPAVPTPSLPPQLSHAGQMLCDNSPTTPKSVRVIAQPRSRH